jgi:hypothetical protein
LQAEHDSQARNLREKRMRGRVCQGKQASLAQRRPELSLALMQAMVQ